MSRRRACFSSIFVMLIFLLYSGFSQVEVKAFIGYPENCCLSYDGTDDCVCSASTSVFRVQKLTIEFWVKPKYTVEAGSNSLYGHQYGNLVLYRGSGTNHWGWMTEFDYSDGTLWFILRDPSTVDRVFKSSLNVWSSSSWYHIAITYNNQLPNSNVKIYVNSSLDVGRDSTYTILYTDAKLFIGAHEVNSYASAFGGLMDEVRIWNATRSEIEIQGSWNRTLNNTECSMTELLGYWRFDEGTGTNVQDLSNQNYNLTLVTSPHTPTWFSVDAAPIVPELQSFFILPLLMITTLLAVIACRRKHTVRQT